jgi:hypothetical protein
MREMVKIEDSDGVRIQKLVHESMNRLKNRCESDESEARVHESYSQIFDSFDSRFIRKIQKIRVQITPLTAKNDSGECVRIRIRYWEKAARVARTRH